MSNNEDQQNLTENQVVVTPEDMKNLRNYTEYFGVRAFDGLIQAANTFVKDPSYTNQQEFVRSFCLWITNSNHETFTDPLWDKPKEVAKKLLDELQANKVLRDLIDSQQENQNELKESDDWKV